MCDQYVSRGLHLKRTHPPFFTIFFLRFFSLLTYGEMRRLWYKTTINNASEIATGRKKVPRKGHRSIAALKEGQHRCKMRLTHRSVCAIWGEREVISRKSRAATCHRVGGKKQQSSYSGIRKIKYGGLLFLLNRKKMAATAARDTIKMWH